MRFGLGKYAVLLLKQAHRIMFSGLESWKVDARVDVNGCGVLCCTVNTERKQCLRRVKLEAKFKLYVWNFLIAPST